MDHDVAAWVTEEASRGARSGRGEERRSSQIRPATVDRRHGVPTTASFGAPPSTPFTPSPGGGRHHGHQSGGFGTEMFLRRVRDTNARGGSRAAGQTHGTAVGQTHLRPTPFSVSATAEIGPGDRTDEVTDGTDDDAHALTHDDNSSSRTEEVVFGEIVADVRSGCLASAESPAVFESACRVRAAELREMSLCVTRASTALALSQEADALDAEATSWSLCWFLLGEGRDSERRNALMEKKARDAIAKRQLLGGDPASAFLSSSPNRNPLPAPLSARVRACARDELNDPVTFRLNRVVAWLEGNQRAALLRESFGVGVEDALRDSGGSNSGGNNFSRSSLAAFDAFGKNEVSLVETARALDARATSDGRGESLSKALDPDGPMNTKSATHPTNADAEARLCRACWRLVRGGMVDAARELCVNAGQPWRAASFGGGAGFGMAPVGAAAAAAFAQSAAFPVALAIERATHEIEIALSATRESNDASANRDGDACSSFLEQHFVDIDAAAFAAIEANAHSNQANAEDEELAGECDDSCVDPTPTTSRKGNQNENGNENQAGKSGRRALWKWACAETARQIVAAPYLPPAARHEAALYGAFAGDIRATLPVCDGDWEDSAWAFFRALLDQRVDAAVRGGGSGFSADNDNSNSGNDHGNAPQPGHVLRDDDDDGQGRVTAMEDAASVSAPRWPTLDSIAATPTSAEFILDTLRPLAEREGTQSGERKAQRDAQRCLILGRTRELVQEVVPRWVFPSVSSVGQNGEDSQNTETNNTHPQAKPNPALLRFATHLLLFLQQSLPENGSGLRGNGPLHFHVNKVVNLYVVHLIATRRYALVPRYAAHLAKATLVETYTRFLTLLAPTDLGTKKRILKEACQWIAVDGDEDEETHDDEPHVGVRAIVAKTMHDSRLVVLWDGSERSGGAFSGRRVFGAGAARGPEHRENILEWALSLAKTRMHAEAATHACALVRQLCLSRTSRALDFENRRRDGDPVSGTTNQSENSENFSSGESRARHLVAELLPPDLQRNASESDAPGAAAELGDWASYLAAASAARRWRDCANARDVAGDLLSGASVGGAADDAAFAAAFESCKQAALDAAQNAVRAVLSLAYARESEDGFYEDTDGQTPQSSDDAGFWLDCVSLVDGPEAISRGLVGERGGATYGTGGKAGTGDQSEPIAVRLLVAPVHDDVYETRAIDDDQTDTIALEQIASSLQSALELRARDLFTRAADVAVTVEAVPGVFGEGASADVSNGMLLVEISVASRTADEESSRLGVAKLAAEALKGDLPSDCFKEDKKSPRLETVSCDASDSEIVRAVCRHVLWPSLLLEAASAEADIGAGTNEITTLVADAKRGLHKLFSVRETKDLVRSARFGELGALETGSRRV